MKTLFLTNRIDLSVSLELLSEYCMSGVIVTANVLIIPSSTLTHSKVIQKIYIKYLT